MTVPVPAAAGDKIGLDSGGPGHFRFFPPSALQPLWRLSFSLYIYKHHSIDPSVPPYGRPLSRLSPRSCQIAAAVSNQSVDYGVLLPHTSPSATCDAGPPLLQPIRLLDASVRS